MRLLTVLAVAALAAGVYHYRRHRPTLPRPKRRAQADQPVGVLGPMQSGIATGR